MEKIAVQFTSDKVTIVGPKVDGGFKVTFDVGEYEQGKIAQLLTIPQNTSLKVNVEVYDGQSN